MFMPRVSSKNPDATMLPIIGIWRVALGCTWLSLHYQRTAWMCGNAWGAGWPIPVACNSPDSPLNSIGKMDPTAWYVYGISGWMRSSTLLS
jgi:hypothetical protein